MIFVMTTCSQTETI